eukprot:1333530-Prymnesium_polylepis.1
MAGKPERTCAAGRRPPHCTVAVVYRLRFGGGKGARDRILAATRVRNGAGAFARPLQSKRGVAGTCDGGRAAAPGRGGRL